MIIDQHIHDELTAQAKASWRLRMNLDLRNASADKSQRTLNAIEPGTVLLECKDGAYESLADKDIMNI